MSNDSFQSDEKYEAAFELIMHAGDAKSSAMMAIEAAREFDFAQAEQYMQEAKVELQKAHQAQTDMMQQEANGKPVELNIILVHAQDHLTMAIMAKDNAEEFIYLYRMIQEIKNGK